MRLAEKIDSKQARICVVGLGYVGLPLAMEFVRSGFNVVGVDVDGETVACLREGTSHISDVSDEEVTSANESGKFQIYDSYEIISEVDCVSICVPTPLRKTRDPDISFVTAAVESARRYLRKGTLVVLESTTYPGTTEEILCPAFEEAGLKVGKDVYVAFSPERVDPGNPVHKTRNTPKIIGGVTPECTDLATRLYEQIIETVVPVSSTRAAEMVKLLENTFRAVNIGLVNELAVICDKLGLSVWEVIRAAATKPFGFMPFYPGPGLGGHCIPIDPLYLSWKLKSLNYNARFIELASEINTGMPEYCVGRIALTLNSQRKAVNGAKILILGVAYKPNVSDTRESPALDIIRLLEAEGAQVDYHDPHVPRFKTDGVATPRDSTPKSGQGPEEFKSSITLTAERVSEYDIVVLTTDHSQVDYKMILDSARLIFDSRNAFEEGHEKVVKL
ncbi:MAG TPA: nucleotide sugar dehydrogenase [Acidobacteriota bacterium]|nr:nucleotide sugar dehydrogenase [Acidobacteriota bacterium]